MDSYLEEFVFKDLYIRHSVDYNPNDKDFQMHIHSKCEIFYFISGNVNYLVEGSKYPLEHGSLLIMRPSESHRAKIISGGKYERYVINFPLSAADIIDPERRMIKPFLNRPLGIGNLYLPSELNEIPIEKYFKMICGCGDNYELGIETNIRLFSILRAVSTAYSQREGADFTPSQSVCGQILAYINSHLSEDLSLSELANRFFISQSQLNRLFKNTTGASPWKYITLKRLTMAKEMIQNGIPAAKAGGDCGFSDYSAFYRAYLKHFGVSPKYDGTKK